MKLSPGGAVDSKQAARRYNETNWARRQAKAEDLVGLEMLYRINDLLKSSTKKMLKETK